MMPPFIIFALPRSRTAWLAGFLSYGAWHCGHEEMRHARGLSDVRAWLSMANTGTAETAAAPWWRTVLTIRPDANALVVRRHPRAVLESCMKLPLFGEVEISRALMLNALLKHDHKLNQIEARWPGVLSVQFDDLAREDTCRRVWEHCLPYSFDRAWWAVMDKVKIEIPALPMLRYMLAFRRQIEELTQEAKVSAIADMRRVASCLL